jgi:hypothetical protein
MVPDRTSNDCDQQPAELSQSDRTAAIAQLESLASESWHRFQMLKNTIRELKGKQPRRRGTKPAH